MRPILNALTLAAAAAFALPFVVPGASIDAYIGLAGMLGSPQSRDIAFAAVPAFLSATCAGIGLRRDGAEIPSALVPGMFALAGLAVSVASQAIPAGALSQIVASSGLGILALVTLGLGLASLCTQTEAFSETADAADAGTTPAAGRTEPMRRPVAETPRPDILGGELSLAA